ncbi:MAG: glycosyltransferase, partial [Actinomycetota bacterium]
MKRRIFFAGGGTAGHVEPALAVADEIVEGVAVSHSLTVLELPKEDRPSRRRSPPRPQHNLKESMLLLWPRRSPYS